MYYFFFQAEDGIRDGTVTGVQTCALPILQGQPADQGRVPHARQDELLTEEGQAGHDPRPPPWQPRRQGRCLHQRERSEERRVGKECRSRWSAYHEKKKRKTHKERSRTSNR